MMVTRHLLVEFLVSVADRLDQYHVERFSGPMAKEVLDIIRQCRELAAKLEKEMRDECR